MKQFKTFLILSLAIAALGSSPLASADCAGYPASLSPQNRAEYQRSLIKAYNDLFKLRESAAELLDASYKIYSRTELDQRMPDYIRTLQTMRDRADTEAESEAPVNALSTHDAESIDALRVFMNKYSPGFIAKINGMNRCDPSSLDRAFQAERKRLDEELAHLNFFKDPLHQKTFFLSSDRYLTFALQQKALLSQINFIENDGKVPAYMRDISPEPEGYSLLLDAFGTGTLSTAGITDQSVKSLPEAGTSSSSGPNSGARASALQ